MVRITDIVLLQGNGVKLGIRVNYTKNNEATTINLSIPFIQFVREIEITSGVKQRIPTTAFGQAVERKCRILIFYRIFLFLEKTKVFPIPFTELRSLLEANEINAGKFSALFPDIEKAEIKKILCGPLSVKDILTRVSKEAKPFNKAQIADLLLLEPDMVTNDDGEYTYLVKDDDLSSL